jgi:hypothetical protein
MKATDIKAGEILSKILYARVQRVGRQTGFGQLHVACVDLDDGTEFFMEGEELLGTCLSATQYDHDEVVSLAELATEFVNVGTRPFTVTFRKKNGAERVLVGRMITPDTILGRSTVLDFEADTPSPLRQVDHRTITTLIVRGVRYMVKRGR